MIKTYSELITFDTFEERFRYLQLFGKVGEATFGGNRYINQKFYKTDDEWLALRDYVIIRDNGCDLGMPGFDIEGTPIIIHHINPISMDDIINRTDRLLNPDFLISTSLNTHNAIHYGDESLLISTPITRTPYDTCPWKKLSR